MKIRERYSQRGMLFPWFAFYSSEKHKYVVVHFILEYLVWHRVPISTNQKMQLHFSSFTYHNQISGLKLDVKRVHVRWSAAKSKGILDEIQIWISDNKFNIISHRLYVCWNSKGIDMKSFCMMPFSIGHLILAL